MVKTLQSICLLFLCGCFAKQPSLEELTLPTDPEIGSIYAREKVLRALLAIENKDIEEAQKLFLEAHKLDPHPTIKRLAEESLKTSEETP